MIRPDALPGGRCEADTIANAGKPDVTLLQLAARSLALTLLGLLAPLGALLLSAEMQWGPGDFAAAALLLFSAIFGSMLCWRYLPAGRWRLLAVIFLLASLLLLWAELAVGIFW